MAAAKKSGQFDDAGQKLRSQHSIFGPVRRVAGPPGAAPRWLGSLVQSWNAFEAIDRERRNRGFVPEGTAATAAGPRMLYAVDLQSAA